MTPAAKAHLIRTLARKVGFDLVGIAPAVPPARGDYYRRWLAAGHAAGMTYLHRNVRVRLDPRELLSGARAIICAAVNYRREDGYLGNSTAGAAKRGPTGYVAQYARGQDYHIVLRHMLRALLTELRERVHEEFAARICVDTAPLLEREYAAAAGLGWFGRNTCLLHPQLGSYLLLGEIVTTLELPADTPITPRCGSCRRCVDACPTGALVAPYELDARRCIAYLTIEHRGPIPPELQPVMGTHVFGCDICQQVCPYNAKAPGAGHPRLSLTCLPARLDLVQLATLPSGAYRRLVAGTAGRRARRAQWRRNAIIALGNVGTGDPHTLNVLRAACADTDAGVAAAAAVSLQRLSGACPDGA